MVDKGNNNKDSVTIAPEVFALMAAHAASNPTSAVHGVLIGSRNGDKVTVTDAFPICHENPTKPLVETALALVQSNLEEENRDKKKNNDNSIIGWFTAPELLHETKPGPVALRIVANLATNDGQGEPVLLVLNNEPIVKLLAAVEDKENNCLASRTVQAFGKDFGMQWMEPLDLTVTNDSGAAKAVTAMLNNKENNINVVQDLVDHWEEGAASEWTSASSLLSFTKKYT